MTLFKLNGLRALGRRTLSQTAVRALTDDPKFYAMVLQFTEEAADKLEDRFGLQHKDYSMNCIVLYD